MSLPARGSEVNSNLRSRLFGAKWLMPAGFGSPFENRIGIKATERDRRRTGWGGAKGPSTGQQVEDLLALVLGPVRYAVRYAFFISANKVDDDETTRLVRRRIEDLEAAITAWTKLPADVAEARLFPLAQFMGDVYAGALLTEQAAWEQATRGTNRKLLVARLYARRYLTERGPLRGIDDEVDEGLERFSELADGALTVDYPQVSRGTIG